MKGNAVNLWLALVTTGLLSGCSSVPLFNSDTAQESNIVDEVSEVENGVIAVIHPEGEVVLHLPEASDDTPPLPVTDVWQRVSQQLNIPIPQQQRIVSQRNWYLKHPEYMQRVVNRARPFLHYVVEQIEQHDMPLELALLPIVESAYDPFAYSHGRASGMWQFIPGTAKQFGMKQTWWYDGRRDVIASTQGALDYLAYLHKFFDGNWLHALAAYNSGEGRVRRAIRANKRAGKPTDFWSLDLPKETRAYVPKLLALADILKHKDQYAFEWPEVDNVAVVDVVAIDSQIDLAFAAEMAGLDVEALQALNPGFNRWATDPEGPHRLLLPIANIEQFSQALANTETKDRLNWVRHKIKSGDSLLKLAKQYHTTPEIIKQINELSSNRIIAGEHLMVPVALKSLSSYSLSNEERLAKTQNKKRGAHKFIHTVKSGDNFWDLSREYKVKISSLAKWNGMSPKDTLQLGQKLVVWVNTVSDSQSQDAIIRKVSYQVRQGDSLSRIASKFNVKTKDIVKWNDLNPKRYLQPGQKLVLHVDVTRSTS